MYLSNRPLSHRPRAALESPSGRLRAALGNFFHFEFSLVENILLLPQIATSSASSFVPYARYSSDCFFYLIYILLRTLARSLPLIGQTRSISEPLRSKRTGFASGTHEDHTLTPTTIFFSLSLTHYRPLSFCPFLSHAPMTSLT